tara:strand:- start:1901 stop:2680 length:780 start_codon:yes stop_codon:yes gene_type:complete
MHKLPPLLAPHRVGNALLMLGVLTLLAAFSIALREVLMMPWLGLDKSSSAGMLLFVTTGIAVICGVLGWIPVFQLWPSPADAGIHSGRKGIATLAAGLVVWVAGCLLANKFDADSLLGPTLIDLVPLSGAWLYLLGLRQIVVEVGARSRVFRTDRIRRQRIWDLLIGILFIAIGIVLVWAGEAYSSTGNQSSIPFSSTFTLDGKPVSGIGFLGMAISSVAVILVLVGLIYLCFNLAWVRSALQSPPPRLREYLSPVEGT